MFTDLQKRKLIRYFHVLDSDRNGYLEKADFDQILRNLAELRGWKPGTAHFTALEAGVMSIFGNTVKHADKDGDGRCTLDEWFGMEEEVLGTPENFRLYSLDVAKGLFDVIDFDLDGEIGSQEWVNFFHAFCRLPVGAALESFTHLDKNGDGRLTKDEILELVREFHYSDDPAAPGNWLFGRW
ncbi:MAG TPA: EF-hand domain-containing protein [Symbiobacteriaceae bacterium]|nr:EF-hand domain-containing protein [Symbiobacteriaceae bacterium]